MPAIKARVRKPVISVQAINITCECGGFCVNDRGSTMIEETDIIVKCEDCGEVYSVPTTVFSRKITKG